MRQKITIAFSVILLLFAVFLIARDLFRKSPAPTGIACCGDDLTELKKIDPALIGYTRVKVIETGLVNLSGCAIADDNSVIVCGNRQVVSFDTSGKRLESYSTDTLSSCITISGDHLLIGTGNGITHYNIRDKAASRWATDNNNRYFTSLAVYEGYVYAADADSKRVIKYDLDGKQVLEIGAKDTLTAARGFIIPSPYFDLAFGGFGDLWIANTGRLRLEHYTTTGYFQSDWGIPGFDDNRFSGCCNPAHFTILPDGSFVTYEKGIDKIKVFDPTGKFLSYVAGAGSFRGNTDFQLGNNTLVKDIAAGANGQIFVLDAYNRINIFLKKDL
jgi:hypothetical protein